MRAEAQQALPAVRHSAVYTGEIRHRRVLPIRNAFRYRTYMLYLDLDELPQVFDGCMLWSYERFNLACFQRRYYLGDAAVPLKEAVRAVVAERTGRVIGGPVRMLTHLRYFGYCYNPVTFYYVFEENGVDLGAVVAEITNTPWGERHTYCLDVAKNENPVAGGYRWQFPKAFHISPFMPMEVQYDWRFGLPGDRLTVHMQNIIDGEKYFDATLTLARRPLGRGLLHRVLVQYPVMTLKVVTMIHWQALRLWVKRTPYYAHPGKKQGEVDESGS